MDRLGPGRRHHQCRGERCFAPSAQTFLQRYNTLWSADWGEDLLPALEEWTDYGVGTLSRNGGLEGRQYKPARTPPTLPSPSSPSA